MPTALPRSFYARPCLTVAEQLIGARLVHRVGQRVLSGRIVETEAYIGEEDRACHARFGQTPRAKILFGEPGHAYVFLIYGMYHCFNVVCESRGRPAAVLVRALEMDNESKADGPGKLCRVLGITRAHNGLDVTSQPLWIERHSGRAPTIVATPRVGVDYAGEWAQKPWRFVDASSPSLSRKIFMGF